MYFFVFSDWAIGSLVFLYVLMFVYVCFLISSLYIWCPIFINPKGTNRMVMMLFTISAVYELTLVNAKVGVSNFVCEIAGWIWSDWSAHPIAGISSRLLIFSSPSAVVLFWSLFFKTSLSFWNKQILFWILWILFCMFSQSKAPNVVIGQLPESLIIVNCFSFLRRTLFTRIHILYTYSQLLLLLLFFFFYCCVEFLISRYQSIHLFWGYLEVLLLDFQFVHDPLECLHCGCISVSFLLRHLKWIFRTL